MDTTNLGLFGQKSNLTYGPIIRGQVILIQILLINIKNLPICLICSEPI